MNWVLELDNGDAAVLARALKAYRPETTEEESVVLYYAEKLQFFAAKEAAQNVEG